jgi:putative transposase
MHFIENEFYHIYNQGNNQQLIYFSDANYLFFIKKIRDQIAPVADILCYCLMPNHFHILIQANEKTIEERKSFGGKPMQELAYRIGMMLSSYSQAINKQNKTTGSLFRQKTKAKLLSSDADNNKEGYLENCFFYVHHNPLEAKLVTDLKDWPFSSYLDYAGLRNGNLCNRELFLSLTNLSLEEIQKRLLLKNWENDDAKFY